MHWNLPIVWQALLAWAPLFILYSYLFLFIFILYLFFLYLFFDSTSSPISTSEHPKELTYGSFSPLPSPLSPLPSFLSPLPSSLSPLRSSLFALRSSLFPLLSSLFFLLFSSLPFSSLSLFFLLFLFTDSFLLLLFIFQMDMEDILEGPVPERLSMITQISEFYNFLRRLTPAQTTL